MRPDRPSFTAPGLAAALLAGVCLSALAGCATDSAALHAELLEARRAAFQQWQGRQHREQASANAPPRIDGELSLEDAAKLALTHNPALAAAIEQRKAARGRILASGSGFLPTVAATAGYRRTDGIEVIDFGLGRFELGAMDNYAVGLEVRQPLSRGGASLARLRAAHLGAVATEQAIREAMQQTLFTVTAAYHDVLLAHFLHEANAQAVTSAREQLDVVQHQQEQGLATRFDVLRAQVELSNFRAERIRQANRIEQARSQLLRAMGVDPHSAVTLSDELTYRPLEPDLHQAVRLAYENRPDLYQAELDVRIEEQALRQARAAYLPRVDALFRYEWSRPAPPLRFRDEAGDKWIAGIEGTLPLFDGFEREGRIIERRAALRQSHLKRLDAEQQAVVEVRQAILDLASAEQLVQSQRLNLERANEALRLVEVGYREGVNALVEVTDARAALTRARGLYYEAIHEHIMARLKLRLAQGLLGPDHTAAPDSDPDPHPEPGGD